MADGTKIEWTDATWNVVNGCSLASPGCTNCYAMKQAHRVAARRGLTVHTKGGMVWTGETRFNETVWLQPMRWRRPRMIFVCAHGDLFHESVPDEWIDRVFAIMAVAQHHTFQVLTKRADRMRAYMTGGPQPRWMRHMKAACAVVPYPDVVDNKSGGMILSTTNGVLRNVWLGVSVEDQTRADQRIPKLLETPAAVRWLSCEPLLGPIDLTEVCNGWHFQNPLTGARWHDAPDGESSASDTAGAKIDWIVAGGESGHKARPMHPAWVRALRDQCAAAGVPFLFKQWGEWAPSTIGLASYFVHLDGRVTNAWDGEVSRGVAALHKIGKKLAGRELDGVVHDGFPQ